MLTDSPFECLLENLRNRWQEWRRGPEEYLDRDRRRQMWIASPAPRKSSVTIRRLATVSMPTTSH